MTAQDEEGKQTMRALARNMTFLIKSSDFLELFILLIMNWSSALNYNESPFAQTLMSSAEIPSANNFAAFVVTPLALNKLLMLYSFYILP